VAKEIKLADGTNAVRRLSTLMVATYDATCRPFDSILVEQQQVGMPFATISRVAAGCCAGRGERNF
jgi:hypothetical protein